jgi:hypothetical protein
MEPSARVGFAVIVTETETGRPTPRKSVSLLKATLAPLPEAMVGVQLDPDVDAAATWDRSTNMGFGPWLTMDSRCVNGPAWLSPVAMRAGKAVRVPAMAASICRSPAPWRWTQSGVLPVESPLHDPGWAWF